jgi:hypothetical protein
MNIQLPSHLLLLPPWPNLEGASAQGDKQRGPSKEHVEGGKKSRVT